MTEPALSLVRRTLAALAAGEPLPGDVADWLSRGFAAYLAGSDLSAALGLKPPPSRRDPRTQDRQARRRAAVKALLDELDGPQLARGEAALELADAWAAGNPVPREIADLLASVHALGGLPADARSVVRLAREQERAQLPP